VTGARTFLSAATPEVLLARKARWFRPWTLAAFSAGLMGKRCTALFTNVPAIPPLPTGEGLGEGNFALPLLLFFFFLLRVLVLSSCLLTGDINQSHLVR
jgi:hypothetical protein